ncbi:MAG: hypothetical protein ACRDAX_07035 [Propionibacteriaceae bacterium]
MKESITERVQRYREHLAMLALIVLAANTIAAVVRVSIRSPKEGISSAMRAEGGLFMGVASVLVICLAVGWCVLSKEPTKHARLIAIAGAVFVTIGTLLSLIFLIGGMLAGQGILFGILEAMGGITDVALKSGAVYILWVMTNKVPNSRDSGQAIAISEPVASENKEEVSRDDAIGVMWGTAAEAARDSAPLNNFSEEKKILIPNGDPVWEDALHGPSAKASGELWHRS